MNIKKNSLLMLGLVFGVSVILYIFDVRILPPSTQITPIISISPIPTTTITSALRSFTETVRYPVKQSNEDIIVTLILKNNIVTTLEISHTSNLKKSIQYHDAFDGAIQPLVIGKNIKDINVSRVAGASGTTIGFMQAIEKIRTQI